AGFRRGADCDLGGNLLLALHTSPRQRTDELRPATLGDCLARVPSLAPRRSAGRLWEEFRRPALYPRQAVRDNAHARRANAGEVRSGGSGPTHLHLANAVSVQMRSAHGLARKNT